MNKEELKAFIGKYILIEFTLYSKKHKCNTYFHLLGRLLEVEDKNVLFKCNYNHEFIIPNSRIKSVSLEGERRTEEEAKKLPIEKPKKEPKVKVKDTEPPLMMVDYSTGVPVIKPISIF
jgi:hypothetical protein